MGGLEGLGALPRIGTQEVGVRIGQRDDPEGGLAPLAGDADGGFAEVELGMAGRVAERNEGLLRVALGRLHRRLHLGIAAPIPIPILVTQALEDPFGRVALLGRGL